MSNKSWNKSSKEKHNKIQKELIKFLKCCRANIENYEEIGLSFIF